MIFNIYISDIPHTVFTDYTAMLMTWPSVPPVFPQVLE